MANHLEHRHALDILLREQAQLGELLCWCCLRGATDDVQWLLQKAAVDAGARDADGDPALALAAGSWGR